jgi:glucose dehydrogenase
MSRDRLILAGVLLALVVVGAGLVAGRALSTATATGTPPPELTTYASQWPAFNLNLANTRDTTASSLNSSNVAHLKAKWKFKLSGAGAFGAFASTPISLGNTIYLQDLKSNVYALNRTTGKLSGDTSSRARARGRMASRTATGCSSATRRRRRSR